MNIDMTLIFLIIILIYSFLLLWIIWGVNKTPNYGRNFVESSTTFSIIVSYRNEFKNLPKLLESLKGIDYPKELFEIIFINDDSEDESAEIVKNFKTDNSSLNILLLNNKRITKAPKKDAITQGVTRSKFKWIVTTDADCIVPKTWLLNLDSYIQLKQPKLIAAPVQYLTSNSFISDFQELEFLSFQGVTTGCFGIGKPSMCNGANLAYLKEAFIKVDGFKGNSHIASGDDVFMLEKITNICPTEVRFLKSASSIVFTSSLKTWREVIQQRLRWAAKSSHYSNYFTKILGLTVLLSNAIILVGLFCAVLGYLSYETFIIGYVLKLIMDAFLIFTTAKFFKTQIRFPSLILSNIIYPFFSIAVAILALTTPYKWKGRSFKK